MAILDLTAPTPEQIATAVEFIQREQMNGTVYVHCKIGYSRSAAVVGAYLCLSGHAKDADDAVAYMRRIRPALIVRPEAFALIQKVVEDNDSFAASPC